MRRTLQERVPLRRGTPQIRKARIPESPCGFVDVATGMDVPDGDTAKTEKAGRNAHRGRVIWKRRLDKFETRIHVRDR